MSHVIVVGAGAIGSHLLPHLARLSGVDRVTVIDRDRYDEGNVQSQDVDIRHVGRPKASVQARRLRRINPRLQVAAIRAAVEDVPLGALRASVILTGLDSRAARMSVNQMAWRVGCPWVDAGIDAGGLLARVRVFVPSADAACLECGWDQRDYDALEQTYPCGAGTAPAPTNAPSALAALAASLQALECQKLLAGGVTKLAGRDVLIDARHHRHYVTEYRRNPACRMPDHAPWQIAPLGRSCADTTLADLLAFGSTLRDAGAGLWFGIAGQALATDLRCRNCGASRPALRSIRRLRSARPRCRHCGGPLTATGMGLHDLLAADAVPDAMCDRPIAEMGVRAHDVITLRTPAVDAHFEMG